MIFASFVMIAATSADTKLFNRYRARVAVDYGPNAIGIATSDALGCIKPMTTLQHPTNLTLLSNSILLIARQCSAREVIVGVPLDSNGKLHHKVKNFNGNLCLNFSKVLAAAASCYNPEIQVLLADERYTTREAKQLLISQRSKGSFLFSKLLRF